LCIDDAFTDGGSDLAASEKSTTEFKYCSDEYGLFDSDGAGTDGGSHGIGHVVGAHTPRHEQAKCACQNDIGSTIIHGKLTLFARAVLIMLRPGFYFYSSSTVML
jgi:hypothetical protein